MIAEQTRTMIVTIKVIFKPSACAGVRLLKHDKEGCQLRQRTIFNFIDTNLHHLFVRSASVVGVLVTFASLDLSVSCWIVLGVNGVNGPLNRLFFTA